MTHPRERASVVSRRQRTVALHALGVMVAAFACLVVGGCVPASGAAAQSTGPCTVDAECTLVDVCGCECHAELGRALPPMACSEACPGRPCEGHRAVCRAGTCVMQ